MQVCQFLQLGKQNGKPSVAIAVDICARLMQRAGMTAKFGLADLRDNISADKCGVRAQVRTFFQLEENGVWLGEVCRIKVPVVHLSAFPDLVAKTLSKRKIANTHSYKKYL